MSKRELIDAIRQVNRSAAPEFLARFAEEELQAYLQRVWAVSDARRHPGLRPTVPADRQLVMA